MSQQDRARVKTVAIDGSVQKPNQMSYLGPSGGVGLMFGAIGGAVVAGSEMSAGQALQMHAQKNNINIENIVANEVSTELKASGKLSIVEAGKTQDATLKITIKQYGFSIPNGFSSKLVPTLSFSCELLDEKGKQIFIAGDSVMPLGNPVDGVSVDELKDPLLIQRLWKAAAQSIAKKVISQL
jgi:hypothetical protein